MWKMFDLEKSQNYNFTVLFYLKISENILLCPSALQIEIFVGSTNKIILKMLKERWYPKIIKYNINNSENLGRNKHFS